MRIVPEITYAEFKRHNDTSKKLPNTVVGRVTDVNLISETCKLTVGNNVSLVDISTLVHNIVYDGLGAISNPSLLKRWSGFYK